MISIGDTIISDDLLAEEFVCNISKCKGECCVSGEAGAPLEKNEIKYLKKNFKKIKPFLSKKGIKAIEKQGVFVKGYNDELETPLINRKECAFTVFSKDGIASCGIEKAYNKGVINFQKQRFYKKLRNISMLIKRRVISRGALKWRTPFHKQTDQKISVASAGVK